MPLDYRNRQAIMADHPEMGQALDDIITHIQSVMTQTNSSPEGQASPPTAPVALNVTAAHGVFDAAITDNASVNRGINYFLEYSKNPSFNAPTSIDLGQSRNHRTFLGNQTLYWRASSSYPTGPRSTHVYHGGNLTPMPVIGGGIITGPEPQGSQGSGTSFGASGSDGGFGNNQKRTSI